MRTWREQNMKRKEILMLALFSVAITMVSFLFIIPMASAQEEKSQAEATYEFPAWFKGVASYWVEGNITDKEFGEGLEFLIQSGVIKVPLIEQNIKTTQPPIQSGLSVEEIKEQTIKDERARVEAEAARLDDIKDREDIERQNREDGVNIKSSGIILSFNIEKDSYREGELINMTGTVKSPVGNSYIHMVVMEVSTKNLVTIAQIEIDKENNNSFSSQITAGGVLMKRAGEYSIELQFGSGEKLIKTFVILND